MEWLRDMLLYLLLGMLGIVFVVGSIGSFITFLIERTKKNRKRIKEIAFKNEIDKSSLMIYILNEIHNNTEDIKEIQIMPSFTRIIYYSDKYFERKYLHTNFDAQVYMRERCNKELKGRLVDASQIIGSDEHAFINIYFRNHNYQKEIEKQIAERMAKQPKYAFDP